MNIIYIDWPCFGGEDLKLALAEKGHQVFPFSHKDYKERESSKFMESFTSFAKTLAFDCCFSYNYYPVVSNCCQQLNLIYISIVYDSPYNFLYSCTLLNQVNYVFTFDQTEYLYFKKQGIETIYYTPLPTNGDRITHLLSQPHDKLDYLCDLSFVGSLYNEDHNFFDRLDHVNDFTKGYLDAIISAQKKIYGYNFIEGLLNDKVLEELMRVSPYISTSTGAEEPSYIYANYYINRKITSQERIHLLKVASSICPVDLYTRNNNYTHPNIRNKGIVDYYTKAPYVYHYSKINLNITLRSIQSGIPLRAMDIMASGGFLLTNYQADFLEHFIPDHDFVYFESEEDLTSKIHYYLTHEDERSTIAKNGYEKVKQLFSYSKILDSIFELVDFKHHLTT